MDRLAQRHVIERDLLEEQGFVSRVTETMKMNVLDSAIGRMEDGRIYLVMPRMSVEDEPQLNGVSYIYSIAMDEAVVCCECIHYISVSRFEDSGNPWEAQWCDRFEARVEPIGYCKWGERDVAVPE